MPVPQLTHLSETLCYDNNVCHLSRPQSISRTWHTLPWTLTSFNAIIPSKRQGLRKLSYLLKVICQDRPRPRLTRSHHGSHTTSRLLHLSRAVKNSDSESSFVLDLNSSFATSLLRCYLGRGTDLLGFIFLICKMRIIIIPTTRSRRVLNETSHLKHAFHGAWHILGFRLSAATAVSERLSRCIGLQSAGLLMTLNAQKERIFYTREQAQKSILILCLVTERKSFALTQKYLPLSKCAAYPERSGLLTDEVGRYIGGGWGWKKKRERRGEGERRENSQDLLMLHLVGSYLESTHYKVTFFEVPNYL